MHQICQIDRVAGRVKQNKMYLSLRMFALTRKGNDSVVLRLSIMIFLRWLLTVFNMRFSSSVNLHIIHPWMKFLLFSGLIEREFRGKHDCLWKELRIVHKQEMCRSFSSVLIRLITRKDICTKLSRRSSQSFRWW